MDYAVLAFHFSLHKYLRQGLERIQKRTMCIIGPGVSYHKALVIMNFKELATHHDEICESLFHAIVNYNNHRLFKLRPAPRECTYSLRRARLFNMPRFTTNSFIIFSCLKPSNLQVRVFEFRISITFLTSHLLFAFLFLSIKID